VQRIPSPGPADRGDLTPRPLPRCGRSAPGEGGDACAVRFRVSCVSGVSSAGSRSDAARDPRNRRSFHVTGETARAQPRQMAVVAVLLQTLNASRAATCAACAVGSKFARAFSSERLDSGVIAARRVRAGSCCTGAAGQDRFPERFIRFMRFVRLDRDRMRRAICGIGDRFM